MGKSRTVITLTADGKSRALPGFFSDEISYQLTVFFLGVARKLLGCFDGIPYFWSSGIQVKFFW